MAEVEGRKAIPLWIDADPSGLVWTGLDCDDDLAILVALALEKQGLIDLQGLSISGGNAPLALASARPGPHDAFHGPLHRVCSRVSRQQPGRGPSPEGRRRLLGPHPFRLDERRVGGGAQDRVHR